MVERYTTNNEIFELRGLFEKENITNQSEGIGFNFRDHSILFTQRIIGEVFENAREIGIETTSKILHTRET
jgi:hypothetical protein